MKNKYLTLERKSLFKRDTIEKLEINSSKIIIENIYEIDRKLEKQKNEVILLLHKLIDKESNKEIRNDLLSLKKKIYNNKNIPKKILNKKDTFNSKYIYDYLELYTLKNKKIEQLKEKLIVDEKLCENNFKDIAKNDFFLSAIVLTNPNFYKEMRKGNKKFYIPGNNYCRTLFMYLERSCVKTSPLSYFTSTSYMNNLKRESSLAQSKLFWNNKNILTIFLGLIYKYNLYSHFNYSFNPITTNNKTILFQPNTHVNIKWKNSDFISHNDIINRLSYFVHHSKSYTHESVLDILYKSKLSNHFQYLFDIGVIKPILNFGLDNPFEEFSKNFKNYLPPEIINILINLDYLKEQLSTTTCNNKRFHNIEEINSNLSSLKNALSICLHSPMLYEDSSHQQYNESVNDIIRPAINSISNNIRNNMYINHIYDDLVKFFKNYNTDYVNLMDFLFDFVNREKEFSKLFRESLLQDYSNPKKINNDIANIHYHVYWQYQDNQIIINKVSLGNYELLHRFDYLFNETSFVNDLDEVFKSNDTHNYKITFGEDISNIQILRNNHSNKVFTNLDYELSSRMHNYLHINDIFLTLQDDMIRFTDSSGRLLNLCYTGSVPKHLNKSWCYIIQVLINPFYLYSDMGNNSLPFKNLTTGIEQEIKKDNIIYRRKKRSFHSKEIYDILNKKHEKSAEILILYKYFQDNEIPLRSYIYICDKNYIGMNKPIYFSIYNLYCIDILKNKITVDGNIIFYDSIPYISDDYTFEYLTAINGGLLN
ncbi:hypothetical protein [Macrococcus equi]|uniref:hypothetical protein n=1 Tax=Macrococcus equi TaxID=3395462 RepID=UPI0039BE95CA